MLNARMVFSSSIVLVAIFVQLGGPVCAEEQGSKQPVFLLCPHAAGYSAWSLYLVVAKDDHKKILSLGLERLTKRNSKDSSYADVLAAQSDPQVKRELVAALDAKDFGSKQLDVAKDDALHVSLKPQADGSYDLMINLRVGASDRFVIGGKEQAKRAVRLVYDSSTGKWLAKAQTLYDAEGVKNAEAVGRTLTGIAFPVTGTGIYRVIGTFDNEDVVILMDR